MWSVTKQNQRNKNSSRLTDYKKGLVVTKREVGGEDGWWREKGIKRHYDQHSQYR